jgi:hypothetical protein
MSVSEILKIDVTSKQYRDVNGFLILNNFMDSKNFFKVECPSCYQNDISYDPAICKKCSNTSPNIRWNLRCCIMDLQEQIKCIMN